MDCYRFERKRIIEHRVGINVDVQEAFRASLGLFVCMHCECMRACVGGDSQRQVVMTNASPEKIT